MGSTGGTFWRLLLIFTFCAVFSAHSLATCTIAEPVQIEAGQPVKLKLGEQRLTLQCNIEEVSVLHFPMDIVSQAALVDETGQVFAPLRGARKSFVLPIGNYTVFLDITASRARYLSPQVDTAATAQFRNSIHLIMMSLFTGFCVALALYVGMLGRSIKNTGFYAYSAYITCAATFFVLQEGVLNAVLPYSVLLNSIENKLLFAGLTVVTAQRFIDRLLDFPTLLKPWPRNLLNVSALGVLMLAVVQLIVPFTFSIVLSQIMGTLTLMIIVGIILATVLAVKQQVHCARLVLLALCIMFVAMVLRVYLHELSPFLHRYALIIAVAIEALILAVAAAEKVKRLDEDKNRAYRRASMDPLCPVLNRRGWETAAQSVLDTHRTDGGYLCLIFIDLDKFKQINDTLGHATGDQTLAIVAQILNHLCRQQDLVGRYGGDEFVVLALCHTERQAERLLARINRRFSSLTINVDTLSIPIEASIGSQIVKAPQTDLAALLHAADMAMYEIKRTRRSPEVSADIQA
ncbi:GGDEF domain-containing protein [Alteromonas halophila]|uniref:diguanylate cyclase n=1 Tax=Alteromonas halophila TaxID=516698 RepID=A0A918JF89_9ALTE|nr:diguanylate cyclase [Alteromonas halophila]GGW78321.1 hypothetical protein GCM10007391_08620 [Alteromonas halophila]